MKAQAILFVGGTSASRQASRQWRQALLLPLGSEPALIHLARHVASKCAPTTLLLPSRLLPQLSRHADAVTLHTYVDTLGDNSLSDIAAAPSGSKIIIINASLLPSVDVEAALQVHRKSGSSMTVFFEFAENNYCREQLATDPAGAVSRAVRQYSDSGVARLQREPLAIVLSRSMFRPDEGCNVASFTDLVEYLSNRMSRAGDDVHWQHDESVRGFARPFDALLQCIQNSGLAAAPAQNDSEPGRAGHARIIGPVQIGKHVSIGSGAVIIGPAAIGDKVSIGPGAVLSHSIVLPGESVAARGHAHDQLIGNADKSMCEDCHIASSDCHTNSESHTVACADDRLKRICDCACAAIALILLSPLLACIALLVKLTSPGPIFFGHARQGRGGIEFKCIKFRTMVQNADALQQSLRDHNEVDGPQFKLVHDPRVTRLGAFLRRSNLDELPQLWNVLCGEMSLVGPRPSPDKENQCCPPWRRTRLSVRPGITGLWQVARSSDRRMTDFQEWIYYDTRYVEHRSLWLDLQIVWQTVRVLLHVGASPTWREHWLPKPHALPILNTVDSGRTMRVSA